MEQEKRNDVFVVHHCKNSKKDEFIYERDNNGKITSKVGNPDYCNNCFIDVDKTFASSYPPTWRYCPSCEAKGFKNPKTRKKTQTPEQIEAFKQRMAKFRESKNA